jgi:hypothetical protein
LETPNFFMGYCNKYFYFWVSISHQFLQKVMFFSQQSCWNVQANFFFHFLLTIEIFWLYLGRLSSCSDVWSESVSLCLILLNSQSMITSQSFTFQSLFLEVTGWLQCLQILYQHKNLCSTHDSLSILTICFWQTRTLWPKTAVLCSHVNQHLPTHQCC